MTRLTASVAAVLVGLAIVTVLAVEPVFAQGRRGPGRGRPGGGRQGPGQGQWDEMEKELRKAVDRAACEAARKALEAGESDEEAKAAARKAGEEAFDKKADELIKKWGQGFGDPDKIKKRLKRGIGGEIEQTADAATERAIKEFRTAAKWKEIKPKDELVAEDKPDKEIEEAIKETTLFEDFKDIADLKLTRPVIIFFFTTDDGTETTKKKAEKCAGLQANVLNKPEFISLAEEFVQFKVHVALLNEPLEKKYKATSIPAVVFFDCTGKRLYSFKNPKLELKTILKKMKGFLKKSEKAKKKALKEKANPEPKEGKGSSNK